MTISDHLSIMRLKILAGDILRWKRYISSVIALASALDLWFCSPEMRVTHNNKEGIHSKCKNELSYIPTLILFMTQQCHCIFM